MQRTTLSARLDRVRSVEVTAPLIHRLLGLTQVKISTGSASVTGDDGFALDGLAAGEAPAAARAAAAPRGRTGPVPDVVPARPRRARRPDRAPATRRAEPDEVLLRFDPRWARFAPLTASGAVIAAAP